MLEPSELIESLEYAKRLVSRLAWALSLHVENDGRVEREGEDINGRIDSAIDRIRTDAETV